MKHARPAPRLLRPGQAADRLGVTTQTIRTWSRPGGVLADAVVYLPRSTQARFLTAKVEALVRKSARGVA